MENGEIPDQSITASSYFIGYTAAMARLNIGGRTITHTLGKFITKATDNLNYLSNDTKYIK